MRKLFVAVAVLMLGCVSSGQKKYDYIPVGTPLAFGPEGSVIYDGYSLMNDGKFNFNNIFLTEKRDYTEGKLIFPVTYAFTIFTDLPMQEVVGAAVTEHGFDMVRYPVPQDFYQYYSIQEIVLIRGQFYGSRILKDGCRMLFRADKFESRHPMYKGRIYHFYLSKEVYSGYMGQNCSEIPTGFKKPFSL